VQEVYSDVAADDPIDRALVDADRARHGTDDLEHSLGTLVGGPMVRLLDIARAFEARGYSRGGQAVGGGRRELSFDIDGDVFGLAVEHGRGHAVTTTRDLPRLTLSQPALAAILYGALLPSDAARLGWLAADHADALTLADELLALPPYFALDPF
jgi:predicted acetyltransferase